ncbi:MAG: branched-chain amino acid ABC transporter permease [bacterium]
MISQLIVNGLSVGSLYALIALAMVIIYKASEVPNFAQGEMAMISTYVAYTYLTIYQWPTYIALPGALLVAALLGVGLEFAFVRRAKEPHILDFILITIGMQLFLHGLAGWKWGADQKSFSLPIVETDVLNLGAFVVSTLDLVTMIVAGGLMFLLFLFFKHTKLGVAMQATQQNRMAARTNGIRTNRIMAVTWGISSFVGAVAGILFAPTATLDPNLMWDPLLKGFAAAVLGGMTTLVGAVLGGLLLGLIENLFGAYVSLEFKSVVAFLMIVAVLWFRPSGLFGRHYVRKV